MPTDEIAAAHVKFHAVDKRAAARLIRVILGWLAFVHGQLNNDPTAAEIHDIVGRAVGRSANRLAVQTNVRFGIVGRQFDGASRWFVSDDTSTTELFQFWVVAM